MATPAGVSKRPRDADAVGPLAKRPRSAAMISYAQPIVPGFECWAALVPRDDTGWQAAECEMSVYCHLDDYTRISLWCTCRETWFVAPPPTAASLARHRRLFALYREYAAPTRVWETHVFVRAYYGYLSAALMVMHPRATKRGLLCGGQWARLADAARMRNPFDPYAATDEYSVKDVFELHTNSWFASTDEASNTYFLVLALAPPDVIEFVRAEERRLRVPVSIFDDRYLTHSDMIAFLARALRSDLIRVLGPGTQRALLLYSLRNPGLISITRECARLKIRIVGETGQRAVLEAVRLLRVDALRLFAEHGYDLTDTSDFDRAFAAIGRSQNTVTTDAKIRDMRDMIDLFRVAHHTASNPDPLARLYHGTEATTVSLFVLGYCSEWKAWAYEQPYDPRWLQNALEAASADAIQIVEAHPAFVFCDITSSPLNFRRLLTADTISAFTHLCERHGSSVDVERAWTYSWKCAVGLGLPDVLCFVYSTHLQQVRGGMRAQYAAGVFGNLVRLYKARGALQLHRSIVALKTPGFLTALRALFDSFESSLYESMITDVLGSPARADILDYYLTLGLPLTIAQMLRAINGAQEDVVSVFCEHGRHRFDPESTDHAHTLPPGAYGTAGELHPALCRAHDLRLEATTSMQASLHAKDRKAR
jgi:hypothetical protein